MVGVTSDGWVGGWPVYAVQQILRAGVDVLGTSTEGGAYPRARLAVVGATAQQGWIRVCNGESTQASGADSEDST